MLSTHAVSIRHSTSNDMNQMPVPDSFSDVLSFSPTSDSRLNDLSPTPFNDCNIKMSKKACPRITFQILQKYTETLSYKLQEAIQARNSGGSAPQYSIRTIYDTSRAGAGIHAIGGILFFICIRLF